MANGSSNGDGNGRNWFTPPFIWQIVVWLLSVTTAGIFGGFSMRDSVLRHGDAERRRLRQELIEQFRQDLRYHVTRDEWNDWRRELDRQYFGLDAGIKRLEERLEEPR